MTYKLVGEVVHKGKVVPIEVEISHTWLGVMGLKVNLPKEMIHDNNLTHLIDFNFNLDKNVREITDEDKVVLFK